MADIFRAAVKLYTVLMAVLSASDFFFLIKLLVDFLVFIIFIAENIV